MGSSRSSARKIFIASRLSQPQLLRPGHADNRVEAADFSLGDAAAQRRQPVIPPPLVVQRRVGPLVGLDDQAVGQRPLDQSVEGAGAEADGAVGALRDLPDDGVAVLVSVGERQLVCFTRALLADPRLVILDEATSAIDAVTEARLQRALVALLRGRTSFVVAHRLSTIRHADLVLVLDQGVVIERGTHAELLARGGHYAVLYRQFVQVDDRT